MNSDESDIQRGRMRDVNAPAWVVRCSNLAVDYKLALAQYSATHLIKGGTVVQMASGTTLNCLMDEIIRVQNTTGPLDLLILTNNLQVLAKGRDAYNSMPGTFGTMQIVLTGGTLHPSLDSLTGSYAAKGVDTEMIVPDIVFFGAAGISFSGGLTIAYHFQDEISTQVAYATRKTHDRVLLCDHSKVGLQVAGFRSDIDLQAMLRDAQAVTVLLTVPLVDSKLPGQEGKVDDKRIEAETAAFRVLLQPLSDDLRFMGKECTLRYINRNGSVHSELCLTQVRDGDPSSNDSVRPIRL